MSENISKQIRSEVTKEGKLLLYIESTEIPEPKEDEVLIRIEASPINPSDLGLLIGPADVSSMSVSGEGEAAVARLQSTDRSAEGTGESPAVNVSESQ